MPPYLAGRETETEEFRRLLTQKTILRNLVLTGLRGVGKTVLLETLKPIAIDMEWLWSGADLSESASLTEERLALRLITDLSFITSNIVIGSQAVSDRDYARSDVGFQGEKRRAPYTLNYQTLLEIYNHTPGLTYDKLKAVLEVAWEGLKTQVGLHGVIFSYDEAQNLADHAEDKEYPLSLLLDVFQSIQRSEIPFMLVLTGLPTLFPKLVEARTYSERMFRVVTLTHLNRSDSRDAIKKPIEKENCPVTFNKESVEKICDISGGYPYFIQFICREVYDAWIQQTARGVKRSVPVVEIVQKLDSDFFAGRWAKATDRQRELLTVVARLENCASEFTVQEISTLSKGILAKPFSPSHVSQMLNSLGEAGLIYKNRYGKYSFAVPLLWEYIKRQIQQDS